MRGITTKNPRARLLLLPEGARKATSDVMSRCSVPEDFDAEPESPRPKQERGVFRDPFPSAGSSAIVVVDSKGVRRRRIEMPAEDEGEDDTVSRMWTWLEEHDPIAVLELQGQDD